VGIADEPGATPEDIQPEPVIEVRLDLESEELTIHSEPEHGTIDGSQEPITAGALLDILAREGADQCHMYWVGALREAPKEETGGDYSFRLAIPTVGITVAEADEVVLILRSAEGRAGLSHWRHGRER